VVEKFVLKSINLLIIFGIKRNPPKSGRSGTVPIFGNKLNKSKFYSGRN
jgi:hypothetical protein